MAGSVNLKERFEVPDEDAFLKLKSHISRFGLLVDAILGTGLASDVRGFFKNVIDFINSTGIPVLAVSGALTASPLASREAEQALDVPVIGLQRLSDPAITAELAARLEERDDIGTGIR